MANWMKEIMVLANDFCLNTNTVREIINAVDSMEAPQGKK